MVDYVSLNDLRVKPWRDAADEWLSLSKWALQAAQDIRDQGTAPLAKDWTDKVGKDAGKKLSALADELEAGADIMRGGSGQQLYELRLRDDDARWCAPEDRLLVGHQG